MRPQLRANSFQVPMAYTCVHALVFKFSVQTIAEDLEIDEYLLKQTMTNQKKITVGMLFLLPSHIPAIYIGLGLTGHI